MCTLDKGICLSGKAAATRKLSSFCLHLAERFNDGSAHDRERLGAAWGLHEYNTLVATCGDFLDDLEVERIIHSVHTCLACFYWLRVEAVGLGFLRRWKPKPKNHQWVHLVEDFVAPTKRNPRGAWCYCDEDFVGRMKVLMVKSHRTGGARGR